MNDTDLIGIARTEAVERAREILAHRERFGIAAEIHNGAITAAHVELMAQALVDAADHPGKVSDGYHTFDDLYAHRHTLYLALCAAIHDHQADHGLVVWRSKLHSDGTKFDGWFLVGIGTTPGEQITYHLPLARWDDTHWMETRPMAPPFDGHTSADVLERLRRLGR